MSERDSCISVTQSEGIHILRTVCIRVLGIFMFYDNSTCLCSLLSVIKLYGECSYESRISNLSFVNIFRCASYWWQPTFSETGLGTRYMTLSKSLGETV